MTALADLESGLSAAQLIPGSISSSRATLAQVDAVADQLVDMARGLTYVEVAGAAWSGRAADVFAAAHGADIKAFKAAAGTSTRRVPCCRAMSLC